MLYFKKLKPLEITENSSELLVIERPRKLADLYLKLFIYLIVGVASLYYTIEYQKSIQSMSSFLLMACSVPIIFAFISASKLISEIRGWTMVFDKQKGQFVLNSKIVCKLNNINKVAFIKREKNDNYKEWIKYKLFIQTVDDKKIVLAISGKTEVISKLAIAISLFLRIQLTSTVKEEETREFKRNRIYQNQV